MCVYIRVCMYIEDGWMEREKGANANNNKLNDLFPLTLSLSLSLSLSS